MTKIDKSNQFNARGLYDVYNVTIAMRDRICGGMPKNPEVIAAWIKARTKHDDELTKAQTAEAIEALAEEETEKRLNQPRQRDFPSRASPAACRNHW